MTLFVLLMTEFDYMDMEEANRTFAFIYFASFIVIFYMVLKTVFTSMLIKVYDRIRQKKQLETQAQANILGKEYRQRFNLYKNLIFCKIEPEEIDVYSQKFLAEVKVVMSKKKVSKMEAKKLVIEEFEFEKKQQMLNLPRDVKNIFIYNRIQISQLGKVVKTKEQIEDEMFEAKAQIVRNKKKEHRDRIQRLKEGDSDTVRQVKKCLLFVFYIIVFCSMTNLQLEVPLQLYASDPFTIAFSQDNMDRIGIRPEEEEEGRRLKLAFERVSAEDQNGHYGSLALENIYDNEMIALWLQFVFSKIIYPENDVILKRNYFVGPVRARLTLRQVGSQKNTQPAAKDVVDEVLSEHSIGAFSARQPEELVGDLIGRSSKRRYEYVEPGSFDSFQGHGGVVIEFPSDKRKA